MEGSGILISISIKIWLILLKKLLLFSSLFATLNKIIFKAFSLTSRSKIYILMKFIFNPSFFLQSACFNTIFMVKATSACI